MNQIKNICKPYRENVKYKLNDNTQKKPPDIKLKQVIR